MSDGISAIMVEEEQDADLEEEEGQEEQREPGASGAVFDQPQQPGAPGTMTFGFQGNPVEI